MMEAIRNSRMGIRVLFVLAAMMLAMMGASVMSNAPTGTLGSSLGTEKADAATASRQIYGTVYRSDTQRATPYAIVELHKYQPNCVQSSCWSVVKSVRADAYGRYNFGYQQTGRYYHVRAWQSVGGQWYQGNHGSFLLRSDISTPAKIDVTIRMPSVF
jgi:hypothetical protein